MALIKCPECGKMISSFAENCPDCGFPLSKQKDNLDDLIPIYDREFVECGTLYNSKYKKIGVFNLKNVEVIYDYQFKDDYTGKAYYKFLSKTDEKILYTDESVFTMFEEKYFEKIVFSPLESYLENKRAAAINKEQYNNVVIFEEDNYKYGFVDTNKIEIKNATLADLKQYIKKVFDRNNELLALKLVIKLNPDYVKPSGYSSYFWDSYHFLTYEYRNYSIKDIYGTVISPNKNFDEDETCLTRSDRYDPLERKFYDKVLKVELRKNISLIESIIGKYISGDAFDESQWENSKK